MSGNDENYSFGGCKGDTAVNTSTVTQPRLRPGWALLAVGIGVFLTSLDVVVVATALPSLQAELGAGLSELEWTINGYNLVFACLVLTGAALGDRFGRRRMYVLGLGLFAAASVLAAMSTSIDTLILARFAQGAAAAVAMPLSMSLLADNFPPEKRGAAMGIWGAIAGVGIAGGPVVGGFITEGLSWEWIFWMNVPFAVIAMVLAYGVLRESHGGRPRLDLGGLLLAGIGLFALTWAGVQAPTVGWGSWEVIGALIVGAVLMAAFVKWETRTSHPMIPLAYFRNRGFATANVVGFCQQISVIGTLFILAQLMQTGLGLDPLQTGLRLLVWTGMPFLVAPIAGSLADKFGTRPFMVAGMLLQTAGLAWIGAVSAPGIGYGQLIGPLIVSGVGISLCFPTMTTLALSSVPPGDTGTAAGANNAVKELGSVFGVAILGAVFAVYGSYESPASAIDGFRAALYVGAIGSIVGAIVAAFSPGKTVVGAPAPASDAGTPDPAHVERASGR